MSEPIDLLGGPTEEEIKNYETEVLRGTLQQPIDLPPPGSQAQGITVSAPKVASQSGVAQNFIAGANEMILGLPNYALNTITGALGIPADKDALLRVFNAGDYETQAVIVPYLLRYGKGDYVGPDTMGEKVARGSGQFTALGAGGAGVVAKAVDIARKRLGSMVEKVAPGTEKVLGSQGALAKTGEDILASASKSPVGAATVETVAGGVSGAGAVLGEETEKSVFGTETGIGAMTGGIAPLYALAALTKFPLVLWMGRKGYQKGKEIVAEEKRLTEGGAEVAREDPTVTNAVVEGIKKQTDTEQSIKNIEEYKEAAARIKADQPGTPELTIAEQSQAPGLTTTQRIVTLANKQRQEQETERVGKVLQSIKRFATNLLGDSTIDLPLFIRDLQGRYEHVFSKLDATDKTYRTKIDQLTEQAAKELKPGQIETQGNEVRKAIIDAEKETKSMLDNLAIKMKINDNEQFADAGALASSQDRVEKQILMGREQQGREVLSGSKRHPLIRKYIEFSGKNITFEDWKRFSSEVSDAIGTAVAKKNKTDVKELTALKSELDNFADSFSRGTNPVSQRFKDYRVIWENEYIGPFKGGYVTRVQKKAAESTELMPSYVTKDDQVAAVFAENTDGIQQYKTLFENDFEKMDILRQQIYEQIVKAGVIKNGVIDETKFASWLTNNKTKVNQIPSVVATNPDGTAATMYDELNDVGMMVGQLQKKIAMNDKRRQALEKNRVYATIARLEGTGQIDLFFDNIIKDPNIMQRSLAQLRRTAKNQGADLKEFNKQFRKTLLEQTLLKNEDGVSIAELSPKTVLNYIAKNERTLLRGPFTQDHIEDIKAMSIIMDRIDQTGGFERFAQLSIPSKLKALEEAAGTTLAGATTQYREMQTRRRSMFNTITGLVLRASGKQHERKVNMLLEEALFNPDMARLLMKERKDKSLPVGALAPQEARQLNSYLFSTGLFDPGEDTISTPGEPKKFILRTSPIESTVPDPAVVPAGKVEIPAIEIKATPIENDPILDEGRSPRNDPAFQKNIQQSQSPPGTPVSATDLFPFDPTLAAIEKRRNAKTGIMSLT